MNLLGLLPAEMDALMAGLDAPRFRADQVLHAIYRGDAASLDDLRQLPAGLREALVERQAVVAMPEVVRSVVSEDGETTKLLLAMEQGTLIETVLMQYPEAGDTHPRSTVCVSTQAGCAMACRFCATGQMGFERNLSAAEVVSQVLHMARLLRTRGQHVTNVVFMGMGEPLANYNETVRAIRLLTDPRALGLGQRRITVSTVGIVRGIDRLAAEGLQVGLAISLHAPIDTLRQELVPTATPDSVAQLVAAGERYFAATGRRVSYEYTLLRGVNDSPALGKELGLLLRGHNVHVNLIPVNPTLGPYERPYRNDIAAFREAVERFGKVPCTIRIEKGSEISAACGQLRTDAGPTVVPAEAIALT